MTVTASTSLVTATPQTSRSTTLGTALTFQALWGPSATMELVLLVSTGRFRSYRVSLSTSMGAPHRERSNAWTIWLGSRSTVSTSLPLTIVGEEDSTVRRYMTPSKS